MRDEAYVQEVNGVKYNIKPGESLILDRYEAVNVVGHYCGTTKVCLKIEHIDVPTGEPAQAKSAQVFVGPDGKEFPTKEALMEHLKKGK